MGCGCESGERREPDEEFTPLKRQLEGSRLHRMGNSCSASLAENLKRLRNPGTLEDEHAMRNRLSRQLLKAARDGDVDSARACLVEGAPANACDEHGWAPLHYSASGGNIEVCRLLLDFESDANAALPDLSTPLMLAVEEAHMPVAKLLLEQGALTKCKDEDGFTALSRCDPRVQDEFRRLTSALASEPAG
mmetsp:Transcript_70828/g.133874  ORF Transcript_70828/g.133874 Transcript_70828/m.133874 type:complete len:191 (+) Transcript_70828:97-669(+)